jgi:DNA-binding IclR family transcriptional regulator
MHSELDPDKEKHNAIEKALSILALFSSDNHELGTIEIGKILGYHKATASRTLLLLAQYGFLEQNEKTKKFKLGPAIVDLGLSVHRSLKNDLIQIAKPDLDELRNTLQETVVLEVLAGKNTVMAYVAEGPRKIRLGGKVGTLMPTNVSAGAKAILSYSSPSEWDAFLETDLPQHTTNSITDPQSFKKQLEEIKATAIAFDIGEHDLDLNAVASPILNMEAAPVAAVVVVGLANRVETRLDSQAAKEVKKTAGKISKRLYFSDEKPSSLFAWLESIKVED